ncbi:response regulator transcription factor [Halobacillus litoralis]|uniref:response regulator transcription factor n=1 Tax=Halobacillus litoralis TaxID=45668 RepID=UPI001CD43287|nr:response regulator transcription factor [Halobacillus litoralis]MCA0971950.1 response regulator transcription factor [Halobacillus litoralis]
MKKILIVEDEPTIMRVLKAYLTKNGYAIAEAEIGEQALSSFTQSPPDLVLLDIMLPDLDGWSILKTIRSQSTCPVIMLTALGEVDHRLKGFKTGADDYITKPFIGEEVVARVRAVLRRPQTVYQEEDILKYGPLHLYPNSHYVTLNGKEIDLTPKDKSLLLFLGHHPNQNFTRDQLLDHVWGMDYEGSDRAVDLAVKRIRKALKANGLPNGAIKTIRGLGYQFHVEQ